MPDTASLQQLVLDGVIDEVLQQLKSGKEADVFLVRKGDAVLAAKLYKARHERNFKNNAGYVEGRNIRSTRDARAIAKGSRYGRTKQEEAWKHAEVDALYKLHAAGVRVPAPDIFYEGVLVMGLVVDAEGYPAPRLADVQLDAEQATAMYLDLLRQVGIMLTCDLIHGDLSPFNVLLAYDGPTIIDLPQVVDAAANPQAEMFFRRDVRNLHQFFAQFAPGLRGHPDGGAELWGRYKRRELFAGYVPELASLKDDTPIPTFKPRHGNRPQRGRVPEVSYKGAPPAQAQQPVAAPRQPAPTQHHARPHPGKPQDPGASSHAPRQPAPGQHHPRRHPGRTNEQRPEQRPSSHAPHHPRPQNGGAQQQRPPQHAGPQQGARPQHGPSANHPAPRPHGPPAQHGRPQHAPHPPGAPPNAHPGGRRRRRRGGRGRGHGPGPGGPGPGAPPAHS